MTLPRLAASGAMSVRIQSAIADAIGAAQDRRGLHRNPPLVRQHHGLQPHQILAAATAGAMDVGNAGGDRDRLRSAPAGRPRAAAGAGAACFGRLRRRLSGGRLVSGCGLVRLGRRRLRRTRLRQRHRSPAARPGAASACARPNRSPHGPGSGLARRRSGFGCTQSISSSGDRSGNHWPFAAGRTATRPFAACFLRAKVHGNSVKTRGKR